MGTTGRVLDHIERGNINFSSVKSVVIDEADQMLKLGFKEDVERVRMKILIFFLDLDHNSLKPDECINLNLVVNVFCYYSSLG